MANNPQHTATIILIIFSIACVVSYLISPGLMEWSKTAGTFESIIVYVLTNPIYLGVFVFLTQQYQIRGTIASILVILALDIQSLPEVVLDGVISPNTYLFIDSIIFRNYPMPLWILYIVLPITLMAAAYAITAPGTFVKTVKRFVG
jgi:hypothetical protein